MPKSNSLRQPYIFNIVKFALAWKERKIEKLLFSIRARYSKITFPTLEDKVPDLPYSFTNYDSPRRFKPSVESVENGLTARKKTVSSYFHRNNLIFNATDITDIKRLTANQLKALSNLSQRKEGFQKLVKDGEKKNKPSSQQKRV